MDGGLDLLGQGVKQPGVRLPLLAAYPLQESRNAEGQVVELDGLEKIAARFEEYFASWGIGLPEANRSMRSAGVIEQKGWQIQFLFGADEHGEYLDFYATHRMTDDRHCRLRSNGSVQELEAAVDLIFYPADATDEQRSEAEREFHDYNERVYRELEEKGFS
jgi:hypothetical protein